MSFPEGSNDGLSILIDELELRLPRKGFPLPVGLWLSSRFSKVRVCESSGSLFLVQSCGGILARETTKPFSVVNDSEAFTLVLQCLTCEGD
jgi:hypothetical protein